MVGSCGKMGRTIYSLIESSREFQYVGGFDKRKQFPNTFVRWEQVDPGQIDVVIDFSLPELSVVACRWCLRHGIPFVSGTTGLSANQSRVFSKCSKKIPVFWAPNMSLGIHWIASVLQRMAPLSEMDLQITEIHHKFKKDKPSGTALFLQNQLEPAVGRALAKPISIRGGGVFGVHQILGLGEFETIKITHEALDRKVFGAGALKVAKWIRNKSPGYYSMQDVLGLS